MCCGSGLNGVAAASGSSAGYVLDSFIGLRPMSGMSSSPRTVVTKQQHPCLQVWKRARLASLNRVEYAVLLHEAPSLDAGYLVDESSINQCAAQVHRASAVEHRYAYPVPSYKILRVRKILRAKDYLAVRHFDSRGDGA